MLLLGTVQDGLVVEAVNDRVGLGTARPGCDRRDGNGLSVQDKRFCYAGYAGAQRVRSEVLLNGVHQADRTSIMQEEKPLAGAP